MLPFAALGWITPIWAAIGMSVSSLTVDLAFRRVLLDGVEVALTCELW